MSVCRECCLLSGRLLCVGPIARPEESYRCDVSECGLVSSTVRRPRPRVGLLSRGAGEKG